MTKQTIQMPASEISIKIGLNPYIIPFPNNDKLIRIERYKNQLTGGTGQQMLQNGTAGMQAFLLSEAIATFTILLPALEKDLNVGSLLELNPLQSKTIVKGYEEYYDWMESWRKVLNDEVETEEKVEDEK